MSKVRPRDIEAVSIEIKPPPESGLILDTPKKQEIWSAYIGSRPRETWSKSDLILLVSALKLELEIENIFNQLLDEGYTINDGERENPLIGVRDKFKKELLSVMRFLGMSRPSTDSKRKAVREEGADEILKMQKKGKSSLLM